MHEVVGGGALGSVYRGVVDGREVALKCIHLLRDDASAIRAMGGRLRPDERRHVLDTFRRECDLLRQLQHENILPFIGVVVDAAQQPLYLAATYVGTGNLHQLIHGDSGLGLRTGDSGTLPLSLQTKVAIGVFSALAYLASVPAIHRDVKPANILTVLSRSGLERIYLADFGEAQQLTRNMAVEHGAGTPDYMAPEMRSEDAIRCPKADVFSAGVVLVEMSSGKQPNPGSQWRDDARTVLVPEDERRRDDLSAMRGSDELAMIAQQCIADRPADRADAVRSLVSCGSDWLAATLSESLCRLYLCGSLLSWTSWRNCGSHPQPAPAGVVADALITDIEPRKSGLCAAVPQGTPSSRSMPLPTTAISVGNMSFLVSSSLGAVSATMMRAGGATLISVGALSIRQRVVMPNLWDSWQRCESLRLSQAQETLVAVRVHIDSSVATVWCAKDVAAVPASAVRACCTRTAAQVANSADVEAELQAVLTAACVNPARARGLHSPSLELTHSRATMAASVARLQYMWAMIPTRYSQPPRRWQSSSLTRICARCAATSLLSSESLYQNCPSSESMSRQR